MPRFPAVAVSLLFSLGATSASAELVPVSMSAGNSDVYGQIGPYRRSTISLVGSPLINVELAVTDLTESVQSIYFSTFEFNVRFQENNEGTYADQHLVGDVQMVLAVERAFTLNAEGYFEGFANALVTGDALLTFTSGYAEQHNAGVYGEIDPPLHSEVNYTLNPTALANVGGSVWLGGLLYTTPFNPSLRNLDIILLLSASAPDSSTIPFSMTQYIVLTSVVTVPETSTFAMAAVGVMAIGWVPNRKRALHVSYQRRRRGATPNRWQGRDR